VTAQLPSRRGMTRQARRTFTKHDPPFRAAGGRFSQESAPPKRLRCRLTPAQSPRNVPGRAVRQRGHGLVELTRLNQGDCDSCVHDVASSDSFSSRLHATGALHGPRARRPGQVETLLGSQPLPPPDTRPRSREPSAGHVPSVACRQRHDLEPRGRPHLAREAHCRRCAGRRGHPCGDLGPGAVPAGRILGAGSSSSKGELPS